MPASLATQPRQILLHPTLPNTAARSSCALPGGRDHDDPSQRLPACRHREGMHRAEARRTPAPVFKQASRPDLPRHDKATQHKPRQRPHQGCAQECLCGRKPVCMCVCAHVDMGAQCARMWTWMMLLANTIVRVACPGQLPTQQQNSWGPCSRCGSPHIQQGTLHPPKQCAGMRSKKHVPTTTVRKAVTACVHRVLAGSNSTDDTTSTSPSPHQQGGKRVHNKQENTQPNSTQKTAVPTLMQTQQQRAQHSYSSPTCVGSFHHLVPGASPLPAASSLRLL